jgi:hypothetical protein
VVGSVPLVFENPAGQFFFKKIKKWNKNDKKARAHFKVLNQNRIKKKSKQHNLQNLLKWKSFDFLEISIGFCVALIITGLNSRIWRLQLPLRLTASVSIARPATNGPQHL